jgi:hypothetical protein
MVDKELKRRKEAAAERRRILQEKIQKEKDHEVRETQSDVQEKWNLGRRMRR